MATQPDLLAILLDHNRWATEALLDDLAQREPAALHHRFEIGPGSIHDAILHIIGAMLRWTDRIDERPLRPSIEDDPRQRSVAELRELLRRADGELRELLVSLDSSGRLGESLSLIFENRAYRVTKAAAALHVLTHGMHHRAQVLNMRRQLGWPPLALDLDVVEWECTQTGQL